ncbi:MAG: hypothetical protein MUF81_03370 [Verrucomicrobia bacterium]|jgi:hypothetical protein|nr:hypothetical protein [Verrucomicrobiota bacterium]
MPLNSILGERWKVKRILGFVLGNALPLLLTLYGLKCILALQGHLTEPNSKAMLHTFYLAPVKGVASVMAGLGYISLALFGYFSCGRPPDEDRAWFLRVMRAIVRWGSLGATFVLWHHAHKLRLEMS